MNHHIRNDLSAIHEDYETIWVEINNHKSKHFLCCCLYRHPSSDMISFTDHMTSILQKTKKENKILFIMGDFNINLLSYMYQSHSETNDFIKLMVSHYLLPHILHSTRVTDHSAIIIDNIFTNNAESDTISGNILSQISDHFPQFLIMKNVTIDYCNVTLFQHDYSKFSEQAFVNSFNKLSWDDISDVNLNINNKFDKFYEKVHHSY